MNTTICKQDLRNTKRQARVLDTNSEVGVTLSRAIADEHAVVRVIYAGSVPSNCGYPALTDGMVIVGFPDGDAVVWACELPANKATRAGVLRRCNLPTEARDMRVREETRRRAEYEIMLEAAEELEAIARKPRG